MAVDTLDMIESAESGSVFTKTQNGWSIVFVRNGNRFQVSGPTIAEALASYGAVRAHDSEGKRIPASVSTQGIPAKAPVEVFDASRIVGEAIPPVSDV